MLLALLSGCYLSTRWVDEPAAEDREAGATPAPSAPLSGQRWCQNISFSLSSRQVIEASGRDSPYHYLGFLSGLCLHAEAFDPPTPGGHLACRVVQVLPDERPCPHPARSAPEGHAEGLHVDLGLNANGLRECEVLEGDPTETCWEECRCELGGAGGARPGWWYEPESAECEGPAIFLSPSGCLPLPDDRSELRVDCSLDVCPPWP
jgi:hypothetical protein